MASVSFCIQEFACARAPHGGQEMRSPFFQVDSSCDVAQKKIHSSELHLSWRQTVNWFGHTHWNHQLLLNMGNNNPLSYLSLPTPSTLTLCLQPSLSSAPVMWEERLKPIASDFFRFPAARVRLIFLPCLEASLMSFSLSIHTFPQGWRSTKLCSLVLRSTKALAISARRGA